MNNKTFGERFKAARLASGLSLQDLSNLINNRVSRQALHRYEKGEVVPDSEMLTLLAEKFNVNYDYFFRQTKAEIGVIEFRKLNGMPSKEESKIIELTREYLERYIELEEILGITSNFKSPLSKFDVISTFEQVNKAAASVRREWKLGCDPIYNVAELLEDNHIKVIKLDADLTFDGLQTWVNSSIPVIAYNTNKLNKPDRIRFTLLHELAHLLLQFDPQLSHRHKESLCHQFASAMLLPEETIKLELGEHRNRLSLEELGNMKRQYGISMQATIMRAKDCGIINDNYTRQLFFLFTHNNWRIDEPVEYIGREESHRFDQLLHRALIEDQISMSKAASLKNQRLSEFRTENTVL